MNDPLKQRMSDAVAILNALPPEALIASLQSAMDAQLTTLRTRSEKMERALREIAEIGHKRTSNGCATCIAIAVMDEPTRRIEPAEDHERRRGHSSAPNPARYPEQADSVCGECGQFVSRTLEKGE